MNSIEELWYLISKRLEKRAGFAKDLDELWEWMLEDWEKILLEYLRKLIESMPQRVKDLYDVKGGHTRHSG
ncbi:hypothetical protein SAICODRAFT_30163, partial [Saitoella complicata NRRL Y-17804]|uniref:uncharacterized protein n=1 Tax=Saitoella complicata (strain BCRC 22490 / CBS 7301 / JCM 7358 / NBRC 10748 / NRRL Y-17804) TaxID=698492 RepID=UPI0008679C7F